MLDLPTSARQREVLIYLTRGLTEREIAPQLGLSILTVHGYIKAIYRHYAVGSRGALLGLWYRDDVRPKQAATTADGRAAVSAAPARTAHPRSQPTGASPTTARALEDAPSQIPAGASNDGHSSLADCSGQIALTLRQRQVLQILQSGCSEKEAARQLLITIDGVHWHVKALYRRLGISSRRALFQYCWRTEFRT
jgi:DNA-binding NarL/FixJ family response regulator